MRKFITGLFVLSLFASMSYGKTLAQLRVAERYKLNDSSSVVSLLRWSDPELNIRNNDVQRNIAQYTRCIYSSSTTTPVAETREYVRPPNCISIDRVSFLQTTSTTSYKKLAAITMGGLDVQFPSWEYNTSGRPMYYYERGNYIGFERPVSAAYVSTDAIKVDYFKFPDDMSNDSDVPFDGLDYLDLYHDVIILGVAAMCKQDENKDNTAIMAEYTSKINLMITSLNSKSDQKTQVITIGK